MTGFADRHIGPDAADRAAMLAAVGCADTEALVGEAVPADIRDRAPLDLPPALDEHAALATLERYAAQNDVRRSLIGLGYHGTRMPAVIRRNVLENPAWYTAYTPYQAEISQGRLEALLDFQQMVCDLTALPVANASLLDEATAAAEAMALAERDAKRASRAFFVADDCHPQTIAVVRTRAAALGWTIIVDAAERAAQADVFGVLLQYPGTGGGIVDHRALIATLKSAGVRVAMATDLLALTMVLPPGELGADIAIGSAQRFGVPLGYGGPHAAFMACTDELKRGLPGRLVGVSVDAHGAPALRLALQAREQHIRREKATSNICTSEVLLAVLAAMYAVYHGPQGLRAIAERVHGHARTLAQALRALGWQIRDTAYFDTLTVATGSRTEAVLARADAARFNLRRRDAASVCIALDELTDEPEVRALADVFRIDPPAGARAAAAPDAIPRELERASGYLAHPVFHAHRSETAMLRYLRTLADRDLALDRTMIPLGSCTMKLNGTTGMLPIGWPGFADLHPFAPAAQAAGYRALIDDLEKMLAAITGYDAVSLQPNSGAQGELAGLLAIRAYHASRGESHRDIVLVPTSAHGTNPASAHMAGCDVVIVACDPRGNIDTDDLAAKIAAHRGRLAALMVTYPSTHGVFEQAIARICAMVHDAGGQVYLDGANLNGLMGIASPGRFGADASHLNLHKTFAIPHGGGGPGVGPLAVRAHLAPFLPGHPLAPELANRRGGPVAAAPHGSAGILPIAWSYIRLMGAAGLTASSHGAILAANYVAARLAPHFPVLYSGAHGRVAHECILDIRPFKASTGITAEDVAKRLVDYGIHAPTLSFPVAGTLMVEPTESEPKAELDRFIEAMIAIRGEIQAVASGRWPQDDNPLRNAPHTAAAAAADEWRHPYSRSEAAYPVRSLARVKYWPPVGRIDNAYGDRHLFCTCPPVE